MEEHPSSAKCENGHEAPKVCVKPLCTQSAPICKEKQCEHSSKHKSCMVSSDVQDITKSMIEKILQCQVLDKQLINHYDCIIKFVEMEKQKCLQSMKEPWARLRGDEGMLFRLLKKGPAKDIKPAMVSKVIEGLAIESSGEVEMLRSQVIQVGKRVVQAVEKCILEIRQLWRVWVEPVDFRFSSEMCHKYIQVFSNGKEIKKTGDNWFSNLSVFALVSPAVSARSRIRVKVVRNGGYVYLGLAHKQQMVQSGYGWPKNDQGVYAIYASDGYVNNVLDPGEHNKYSSFRSSQGEEVEMEYDPSSGALRVENRSKNTSHTLKNIKQQEGNPLHFCVQMYNKDDQVEIMRGDW